MLLLLVAGGGPGVVAKAGGHLAGWGQLFPIGGPEPSVDVFGFEIRAVFATFEVAQPSRGPDIRNVI